MNGGPSMSEQWLHSQGVARAPQPAPDDATSGGALLRRAREATGLHVAALAVSLKVPVRKLEALEDDRWDVLPDAVFVRALASSVCRTLKIDPRPVLDRLPQTSAPRLIRDGDGINTPFRAPSDGAPPGWRDQLTRPVVLAVFALLLGALVLVFLPNVRQAGASAAALIDDGVQPPPPVAIPARQEQVAVAPVTSPAASSDSGPAAAMPDAPAPAGAASASTAPSAVPASGSAPVAPPAEAAASGIVVFRTRGPSWIEVTDARGVVAVRKVLEAGESAAASGALPLQVTIGRVDQTDVQVRGKAFDLQPVSKDNVARFEVK